MQDVTSCQKAEHDLQQVEIFGDADVDEAKQGKDSPLKRNRNRKRNTTKKPRSRGEGPKKSD